MDDVWEIRKYHEENWRKIAKDWSHALRQDAVTYGTHAYDSIETSFHSLKAAILLSRRPTHTSKTLQILRGFCCEKVMTSVYACFIDMTTGGVVIAAWMDEAY